MFTVFIINYKNIVEEKRKLAGWSLKWVFLRQLILSNGVLKPPNSPSSLINTLTYQAQLAANKANIEPLSSNTCSSPQGGLIRDMKIVSPACGDDRVGARSVAYE